MRTSVFGSKLSMKSRNLDYMSIEYFLRESLIQYLGASHQKVFIIGVSGGVDSAVVSTLCAKTGVPTLAVMLPIYQRQEELDRAEEHLTWLSLYFSNVETMRVDLTDVFESMKGLIHKNSEGYDTTLTFANTRSRLRMTMLYAIANTQSGLVVGTGNKVEDYGIGFFTKFGDGGVDVSPIGDLYKSEVLALGRSLGISSNLTEAIPTDGLHTNGATDEEQIGATYDELEWAMVEYDLGKREYDFTGRAQEVMQIYSQRHEANNHKMNMPPIFSIFG